MDAAWELCFITGREVHILRQRAAGKTLKGLGAELQVTRERIRQIELRALRQVRGMLAEVAMGEVAWDSFEWCVDTNYHMTLGCKTGSK